MWSLSQFSCLSMSKGSLDKEHGSHSKTRAASWCEEGSHPRCLALIMQTSRWNRKPCIIDVSCEIFHGIKISSKAYKLTSWKWWIEHACVIVQALIGEVFLIFYVQHIYCMNLPSSATRPMLPWASSSKLNEAVMNAPINLFSIHIFYTFKLRNLFAPSWVRNNTPPYHFQEVNLWNLQRKGFWRNFYPAKYFTSISQDAYQHLSSKGIISGFHLHVRLGKGKFA